jgi:hypothetical protein
MLASAEMIPLVSRRSIRSLTAGHMLVSWKNDLDKREFNRLLCSPLAQRYPCSSYNGDAASKSVVSLLAALGVFSTD